MEKELIINGVKYVMVENQLPCQKEWEERKRLCAKGDKLRAEGRKFYAEGNKLYAEGDKLRAEGNKLRAEGDKLWAEGNLQFFNAVIQHYGKNAFLKWIDDSCQINDDLYR